MLGAMSNPCARGLGLVILFVSRLTLGQTTAGEQTQPQGGIAPGEAPAPLPPSTSWSPAPPNGTDSGNQQPGPVHPPPSNPPPVATQSSTYPYTPPVQSTNANYGGNAAYPQQSGSNPQAAHQDARDVDNAESKVELPTMSIRLDPFNWLLMGRLGVELESQVWKFISVETVPLFVVNDQPPMLNLNLSGFQQTLYQSSAGVGALAGASLGVGFWFNGKPMEGYVLRVELTDYLYNYDSRDAAGSIDHVKYVDREFQVLIGSHSKWGPVTLAGTFGIGAMLNRDTRCFPPDATTPVNTATSTGCVNSKELSIGVARDISGGANVVNLHDWTYPITLNVRISLGVVF